MAMDNLPGMAWNIFSVTEEGNSKADVIQKRIQKRKPLNCNLRDHKRAWPQWYTEKY